jgi:hypothetical protein
MTIQHPQRVLACLLLVAAGACTREEVDHDVDRMAEGTHRAADKLDVSLHKAKEEAKHMGDKLKAFGEQVKEDAKGAREDIRRRAN